MMSAFDRLTESQRDIVRLRCERGLTNNEIAEVRASSPQTVKNHLSSVFERTGFRSSPHLCFVWGREHGLSARVTAMRPGEV